MLRLQQKLKAGTLFLVFAYLNLKFVKMEDTNQVEKFGIKYPVELLDGRLTQLNEKLGKCKGFNILEISIQESQQLFNSKKLTVLQLTRCYLRRIEAMNPYLNAVIEVNPDAETIAKEIDLEKSETNVKTGPLHGIPILIKGNIGTKDKMQTTAGSPALLGIIPKKDALVVAVLRKAGAVILGKTNLSEFAHFRGIGVTGGWSGIGNQTYNPYVLSAYPSGSSSGSSTAIAANLAVASLGTETDGSIVSPAHHASLIGLKPTVGLVPTDGVIPISFTQDTVGPIARSVADAAIIWKIISGHKSPCKSTAKNFKNYRIGALRDPFWDNTSEQLPILESLLEAFRKSRQITVVDPVQAPFGLYEKISESNEIEVLSHEFKDLINRYLAKFALPDPRGRIRSLADIIAYNFKHPSKEGYNQDLLIGAEATDGIKNATYVRIRTQNQVAARTYLLSVLDTYNLDAIVTPTEPFPGDEDIIFGNSYSYGAIAGYPYITVPAGFTPDNLPFGICFMGKARSEHTLLKIAQIAEERIAARRPPQFLPPPTKPLQ